MDHGSESRNDSGLDAEGTVQRPKHSFGIIGMEHAGEDKLVQGVVQDQHAA